MLVALLGYNYKLFDTTTDVLTLGRKVRLAASFLFNAPLIFVYPVLVQSQVLSRAHVNLLLHIWLFCTWGLQARMMSIWGRILERELLDLEPRSDGKKSR